MILDRGGVPSHTNFTCSPPWEEPTFKILIEGLLMKKAASDQAILRHIIEKQISSIVAGATHIFTDGSVDTEYESAGAALCMDS